MGDDIVELLPDKFVYVSIMDRAEAFRDQAHLLRRVAKILQTYQGGPPESRRALLPTGCGRI
jgi:hypothetical protein